MPTRAQRRRREYLDLISPSSYRTQHDVVERLPKPIADTAGGVARPFKTIDILAAMEKRGAITAAMRAAAEQFRECFQACHFDQLRAQNLEWRPKASRTAVPGARAEAAREAAYRAICAVGGLASDGGSILWRVVGFEISLKRWALERTMFGRHLSQENATGVLIATLGMLEAYYAGSRR